MRSSWIACYKAYFEVPYEFQWILCSDKETECLVQKKIWFATIIYLNIGEVPQVISQEVCSLSITSCSSNLDPLNSSPFWFLHLTTRSSFSSLHSLNAMINPLFDGYSYQPAQPPYSLNLCLYILPSRSSESTNHLFSLLLLISCQVLLEKLYNCWFMPWQICNSQTHLDL